MNSIDRIIINWENPRNDVFYDFDNISGSTTNLMEISKLAKKISYVYTSIF